MTFCSLAGRKATSFWGFFFVVVFKFYLTCNHQHLGGENIKGEIKNKMYLGGQDSYFEMEHIESLESFLASCDFFFEASEIPQGQQKAPFLLPKAEKENN